MWGVAFTYDWMFNSPSNFYVYTALFWPALYAFPFQILRIHRTVLANPLCIPLPKILRIHHTVLANPLCIFRAYTNLTGANGRW